MEDDYRSAGEGTINKQQIAEGLSSLLSGVNVSLKGRGLSTHAYSSVTIIPVGSKNLHMQSCHHVHNTTTVGTHICIQTNIKIRNATA